MTQELQNQASCDRIRAVIFCQRVQLTNVADELRGRRDPSMPRRTWAGEHVCCVASRMVLVSNLPQWCGGIR